MEFTIIGIFNFEWALASIKMSDLIYRFICSRNE